jgi:hypothetical protein
MAQNTLIFHLRAKNLIPFPAASNKPAIFPPSPDVKRNRAQMRKSFFWRYAFQYRIFERGGSNGAMGRSNIPANHYQL